jgi:GT2 family glycosyltransferase
MARSISLLIVSYNGRAFLERCLASVFAGTRIPDEVIVVDNGSADGTGPWLVETYPSLICLPQAINLGFVAANNLAFAHSHGDLLFTLNNDTEVAPHALASLVAALDGAGERAGAAMGTMVFAHRPEIVACAGIDVSANGVAVESCAGEPYDATAAPFPVFGASAGAALYRRDALVDVGFFDPAFFMYLEDADLAWRLRLRGWGTVSVPAALVRHVYSGTAGFGSPRKAYYLARNRWWCLGKNLPDALMRRCLPQIVAYDAAAVGYALATGDRASLAGRAAALRDARLIARARAAIQPRVTASPDEIAVWLKPSAGPLRVLLQRRRIAALLRS